MFLRWFKCQLSKEGNWILNIYFDCPFRWPTTSVCYLTVISTRHPQVSGTATPQWIRYIWLYMHLIAIPMKKVQHWKLSENEIGAKELGKPVGHMLLSTLAVNGLGLNRDKIPCLYVGYGTQSWFPQGTRLHIVTRLEWQCLALAN